MCTTEQHLTYLDYNQAFVGARNVTDINNSYIKALESSRFEHHQKHAEKLHEFEKVDSQKQKRALRREYKAIKSFLKKWSRKHGIKVIFTARKKDWIGFNAKILLFQKNGRDLDAIRDLLGFRLILVTEYPDTARTHQLCYQLANDLLDFLKEYRSCTLLKAEPRSGSPLNPLNKPESIFIYNKNELKPEYRSNVKNYLIIPKKDLYQALHFYIKTKSGLTLEFQIHTIGTYIHAQKLHKQYKSMRYEDIHININYKKINIPGLVFDDEGNVLFDNLGIFLSDTSFLDDENENILWSLLETLLNF